MSFINPNYKKYYSLLKKLPAILTITILFLVLVWSIVDVNVFNYTTNYGYTFYGIMRLPSAFLELIIWWAIGLVIAGATWFFSVIAVSATITKIDAILEINGKLNRERINSNK